MKRKFARLKYLTRFVVDDPRRVWRQSCKWVMGRIYPRYKRAAVIIPCSGGLGDNLMVTTVAHEVRKRNPDALVHVITHQPAVFDRNPDVNFVSRKIPGNFAWLRSFRVGYTLGFPWQKHLLRYCCDCVNITDEIELKTYIFPDAQDREFADGKVSELGSSPILIARAGGPKTLEKKIWPREHWEKLVQELLPFAPVLDVGVLGTALEIADPRYRSLLGQTSVHQLAALMGRARGLITVDSGPNHLAAAFALPTVCILGGVLPPVAVRYPNVRVLANRPDCCDCWATKACHRNLECLTAISVDDVLKALDEICPGLRKREGQEATLLQPQVLKGIVETAQQEWS